jgi:hypothetical protein
MRRGPGNRLVSDWHGPCSKPLVRIAPYSDGERDAEAIMNKLISSSAALTVFLSIAGCGGSTTTEPSGTEPPTSVVAPKTVSISGFVQTSDGKALPDADVCLLDGDMRCTTSGADGAWTLSNVSADTQQIVTFEKAGLTPMVSPIQTREADVALSQAMVPAVRAMSFMGTPADTNRGQLEFLATPTGAVPVDVSVTLTGLDGRAQEPVYVDRDGKPAANAATGSRGGFVNLPTGDYLLTFSGASATCVATDSGFTSGYLSASPVVVRQDPTGKSLTILVPVIDGYLTGTVAVACTGGK